MLPETGLESRLVSYTKGCYVGQEIIARVQTYGQISRKLMGITLEGSQVPEAGDAIRKDGQPVGAITSACFSPALKQPIAMGYVKRPVYVAGTNVLVKCGEQQLNGTLVNLPFMQSGVIR